jgi:lysosomal acid lipase/cholesteryl ester hydrolase
MARVPLLGRLDFNEYFALIFGFSFLAFESLLHIIILCLPTRVINWFYCRSRELFLLNNGIPENISEELNIAERILKAKDFGDICDIYGYTYEEHVVLTKDGYLLGLHRLPSRLGEKKKSPGTSTGRPVVYLHHGLLMNSEIWICLTDPLRALPFVLVENGYDVWLGNNRYLLFLGLFFCSVTCFFGEETNIPRSVCITAPTRPSFGISG